MELSDPETITGKFRHRKSNKQPVAIHTCNTTVMKYIWCDGAMPEH